VASALAVLPGTVAPTAVLSRTRRVVGAPVVPPRPQGTTNRSSAPQVQPDEQASASVVRRTAVAAEGRRCLVAAAAGIGTPGCDEVASARAGSLLVHAPSAVDRGPFAGTGRTIAMSIAVGGVVLVAAFGALRLRRRGGSRLG
jgi:hypothetical protein